MGSIAALVLWPLVAMADDSGPDSGPATRASATRASVPRASVPRASVAPLSAAAKSESISRWVSDLESPSFHARRNAQRNLIQAASDRDGRASDVTAALRGATGHASLEVRLAAGETLRQIKQHRIDDQLDRLADPRTKAESIRLPGWITFAELVGHDTAARSFFARLYRRYAGKLGDVKGMRAQFAKKPASGFDPYRMSPQDEIRWAMLLWMNMGTDAADGPQPDDDPVTSRMTGSRIAMSLGNPALGPAADCDDVVRRLIGHWIQRHPDATHPRTTIQIAMRYRCNDQARMLCQQVLSDRLSSPASVVTAMLAASALNLTGVDDRLGERLGDHRVAHVWQTIASEKTTIKTQVRDVALALSWHRSGTDPREVGFTHLQADATLVFTDHSLGFPDQPARDRALTQLPDPAGR